MIAEFNWWLLIVGLVVGVGLTWLVLADTRRRDVDVEERELVDEAAWLTDAMAADGEPIPPEVVERMLRLHRVYLGISEPPSDPDLDELATAGDAAGDASAGNVSAGNPPVVERDHPEPEPPVRDFG
jgi:hypothetical protein